ncbi:MAG: hypothetical protein ABS46_12725 [Cytophagaceae bacterium SCN 52-12]|nr:MAG: hypothetical protein ABS46_12725 [Cytophagaceae bacterium SCN 52-12]
MQKLLVAAFLMTGLYACKNAEIDHPDFDYTTGYFPYQYPVRTLVLGDDIYDNTNDNAHKFVISVAMGGVYENTKERSFSFRVDETLCNNAAFNGAGDTILPLPAGYYSLSSPGTIVIPGGKVNGGVEVQLTDAFFSDPKAITLGYVVPLVLTGSNDVDSILTGSSTLPSPDRRIAGNWIAAPKDFTMFAIKYINEFHGNYFHSGEAYVADAAGKRLDERVYKKAYIEQNDVRLLTTTARNQVKLSTFLQSDTLTGQINMLLDFNGNQCTVSSADTNFVITGTGEFKKDAFEWGNKKRNGITLTYEVTDGVNIYHARDELVARDRAVKMETFTPAIIQQ